MTRLNLSIKGEYQNLIKKILELRPNLKNVSGTVERALDYYLDYIVKLETKEKQVKINGVK